MLKSNTDVSENVQRRYTESIRGVGDLTYLERLHELDALTVANQRIFADIIFILKYVHKLIDCSTAALEICPFYSITRSSGCRQRRRHPNSKTCANLFCFRTVSTWNNFHQTKSPANLSANLKIYNTSIYLSTSFSNVILYFFEFLSLCGAILRVRRSFYIPISFTNKGFYYYYYHYYVSLSLGIVQFVAQSLRCDGF